MQEQKVMFDEIRHVYWKEVGGCRMMRLHLQQQIEKACRKAMPDRLKTKTHKNLIEANHVLFSKLQTSLLEYAAHHFDMKELREEVNR